MIRQLVVGPGFGNPFSQAFFHSRVLGAPGQIKLFPVGDPQCGSHSQRGTHYYTG